MPTHKSFPILAAIQSFLVWQALLLGCCIQQTWASPQNSQSKTADQTQAAEQSRSDSNSIAIENSDPKRWYRGNLHTHSFWSDGNDFPEMIVKYYSDRGYHFLALTDHNILSRGEKWMSQTQIEKRGGEECIAKYREAFPGDWIKTRQKNDLTEFQLCPLSRFRPEFDRPGEFLLIEGEEISDNVGGKPIHLNATNLTDLLRPTGGATVREAIDANLRAAAEQARKSGRQIMVHLNHPNFGWAVTAEDMIAITRQRFFEVYNGHPAINHLGDKNHPSIERMWDIINTLRIDKLELPPLLGLGTDDSHHYHGVKDSRPGRGWVVVRSTELSEDALLTAMNRGDFYASSGVELTDIKINKESGELKIDLKSKDGETFTTRFIGTRRGYNEESTARVDDSGKPLKVTRKYSSDIGEVLATDQTLSPKYKFNGDEIYVRAVITSSRKHPDPSFKDQHEQAWTQPIVLKK